MTRTKAGQVIGGRDLAGLDLFFVENVGNLICPVGYDLGQDIKVGYFSVSEGDDKVAKHPYIVREADVLLLNKIGLFPHVPFDLEKFRTDVSRLNPKASPLEFAALEDRQAGMDRWIDWIERRMADARNI